MTPLAIRLGCVDEEQRRSFEAKARGLQRAVARLEETPVTAADLEPLGVVNRAGRSRSALDALSLAEVGFDDLVRLRPALGDIPAALRPQIEGDALYRHYIERQSRDVEALRRDDALLIPDEFDFAAVSGLSNEMRAKLERARPQSLGQAMRIEGMTPAAAVLILAAIRRADPARGPSVSGADAAMRTDALDAYWDMLARWNTRIRLVSRGDLADGWTRHVEDSLQLVPHLPPRPVRLCDLGSGGGLPAIPVAIERRRLGFADALTLIESDERKAAFLRQACRRVSLEATVIAERIERGAVPGGAGRDGAGAGALGAASRTRSAPPRSGGLRAVAEGGVASATRSRPPGAAGASSSARSRAKPRPTRRS